MGNKDVGDIQVAPNLPTVIVAPTEEEAIRLRQIMGAYVEVVAVATGVGPAIHFCQRLLPHLLVIDLRTEDLVSKGHLHCERLERLIKDGIPLNTLGLYPHPKPALVRLACSYGCYDVVNPPSDMAAAVDILAPLIVRQSHFLAAVRHRVEIIQKPLRVGIGESGEGLSRMVKEVLEGMKMPLEVVLCTDDGMQLFLAVANRSLDLLIAGKGIKFFSGNNPGATLIKIVRENAPEVLTILHPCDPNEPEAKECGAHAVVAKSPQDQALEEVVPQLIAERNERLLRSYR